MRRQHRQQHVAALEPFLRLGSPVRALPKRVLIEGDRVPFGSQAVTEFEGELRRVFPAIADEKGVRPPPTLGLS
jgi:hypothetical protein